MFTFFIGYVGFVVGWCCAFGLAAWLTVHEDSQATH